MDICRKIARDEGKIFEKEFSHLFNTLEKRKLLETTKLMKFFKGKDKYGFNINYKGTEKILLPKELNKCLLHKVITEEMYNKVTSMIKSSDPEIINLAKEIVNKYRNKRLKIKK